MELRHSWLPPLFAAVASMIAGCATAPAADVQKSAADVRVYGASELPTSQYQVVSHLWVDSWRTGYRVPTYATQEEAVAALRVEAGRLGADGLINVFCLDQDGWAWMRGSAPAILCYGNAIRVGRAQSASGKS
jgi:uncharacterized protein YbjQ (UPF0145 family)